MSAQQYAVSSRVRLARNLNYPYPDRLVETGDIKTRKAICEQVKEAFFSISEAFSGQYDYIDMDTLPREKALELTERHLISPAFAGGEAGRGLIVSKSRDLSIMINEEDHLRIQAFADGYAIKEAYEKAKEIDRLLGARLAFAYSEKLGYLSACHTNLGTGMRASCMLHLPVITSTGALRDLISETGRLGVTMRGNFGEGSGSSAELYQLSNMFTLGVSDEEILDRITRILDSVCAQEKKLAEAWYKADALAIEDRIYRAEGTARYARSMSSKEWEKLYSLMRLGAELGINHYKPIMLDGLYKNLRPAVLAAIPEGRTPEGRDRLRADMLRQSLEKEVIE